jgi:hypothetical protein
MKIIDKTIIKFKSLPEFFILEHYGDKPNTIRQIEDKELKEFMTVRLCLKWITIINTDTNATFTRELTNISCVEFSGVRLWIFSWKSYDLITS